MDKISYDYLQNHLFRDTSHVYYFVNLNLDKLTKGCTQFESIIVPVNVRSLGIPYMEGRSFADLKQECENGVAECVMIDVGTKKEIRYYIDLNKPMGELRIFDDRDSAKLWLERFLDNFYKNEHERINKCQEALEKWYEL